MISMEGEVFNCIWVWIVISISLFYCHTIGKKIPQGKTRLFALIPIITLFLYLPLNLTTMHLGGLTSFFIAWLANFKLLLFAFGKGPLSNPTSPYLPIPLSQFIPMACLPIKISQKNPSPPPDQNPLLSPNKGYKSLAIYACKFIVLSILVMVYNEDLNPYLKMAFYCIHIYIMLEILLLLLAKMAKTLIKAELEPQFNEPYLATSLQDFWGYRWNLMVSGILRPAVYTPVMSVSTRLKIPKKWAPLLAIFSTFLVSGLMHEIIFYHLGRLKPTGEITLYFIIEGVALCIELVIKKVLDGKFKLHPYLSRSLVWGFVFATTFWFFFPPFMRFNPEVRGCKETVAFLRFITHGELVSPYDVSCPVNLEKL